MNTDNIAPLKHIANHRISGKVLPALAMATSLCLPLSLHAEDQSYQSLRDWIENSRPDAELTPGQHLTINDRGQKLEALIPHTAWKYYFFDNMDMEIGVTRNYPAPDHWGKNMAVDYKLDEDATLVGFTGGGFPFSEIKADDPVAGQKVIWNMLWRPGTNDFDMPMVTWLRGESGKLDRIMEYTNTSATYARGDHSLVPGYEEVKSKRVMEFRSPRDMAGAKDMSITYVDHRRENSGWLYMPAQRKPRRTLASERTGELMGMDMIREDNNGFGGKVYENTWEYLGKRKILATINVESNPEFGGDSLWVPHKTRWEVRDTHVVLIKPKSEDHPYSARVVFVDAETYWTHWMFAFDKKDDQLFRMNQHFLKYSEDYDKEPPAQAPFIKQDYSKSVGHSVFLHLGQTDINAKKPHATMTHCFTNKKEFTAARAKQFYSLRNMISGRR
ncbi:MAG: hypothetical protein COA75_05905 [Cellvibrionales bacterium]|nr:MAG: hypothetical protein COA75_05905 [Cellvibrionales bacterium]